MVTMYTNRLRFKVSPFCPHGAFTCFVWVIPPVLPNDSRFFLLALINFGLWKLEAHLTSCNQFWVLMIFLGYENSCRNPFSPRVPIPCNSATNETWSPWKWPKSSKRVGVENQMYLWLKYLCAELVVWWGTRINIINGQEMTASGVSTGHRWSNMESVVVVLYKGVSWWEMEQFSRTRRRTVISDSRLKKAIHNDACATRGWTFSSYLP